MFLRKNEQILLHHSVQIWFKKTNQKNDANILQAIVEVSICFNQVETKKKEYFKVMIFQLFCYRFMVNDFTLYDNAEEYVIKIIFSYLRHTGL